MRLLTPSTKPIIDSLGVKHQLWDVYRDFHGITRNAWVIECNGDSCVHMQCESVNHYERKLKEYLEKHSLKVAS